MTSKEESRVEEIPESADSQAPQKEEDRNINVLQVAGWFIAATANNKNFLVKPRDLRILYMLVLWDFISRREKVEKLEKDSDIVIPESRLRKMAELVFGEAYYANFNHLNDM